MKHMITMNYLLVTAMLALAAFSAQATEYKGVVGIGLDFGGDTLVSGSYTDGSTYSVKANQGLAFNGGVVMINGAYETQATVGYKFGGPTAKNGSITWDVMPVEIIQFIRTSNMRMGLGFSYQINPKLVIDIPNLSQTTNYDNALGFVIQAGWAPEKMPFSIDLRYTAMKYRENGVANAKDINGNAIGIYSSFYF